MTSQEFLAACGAQAVAIEANVATGVETAYISYRDNREVAYQQAKADQAAALAKYALVK